MKVGLFDHIERSDRPLATEYDERLAFLVAADAAGFYCAHLAEHHCTPLNMVPAPSIFLGILARLTKQIHFGPLVYLLPLYSPLRLIEEICMLDHLSRGRLEVGVGRGVSPYELNFHKVDHDVSREIFTDAFACLETGLTHERFSHSGKYFNYNDVPMPMRPYRAPHPPFWYGSSNTIGSLWAGEQGMNFTANGPTETAKVNIAAFKEGLAKRGSAKLPKPEFPGGAAIGALRHIVVADTDAEAMRIAKPAFDYHLASLNYLRTAAAAAGGADLRTRLNVHRGINFAECLANGMAIVGSPATVLAAIERQVPELGINYLLAYLFFGTMSYADAKRSLDLFAAEVMPKLAAL
ncbi:MAG TPA: LLM class flavin-dependent oxidoreductase [Stellaceae bacterium]|nr:LLM class flavin-dependent oxidoreductase [Stellaceae bacterium]